MNILNQNNWEIADLVELVAGNYFSESRKSWIYGIGYIQDIILDNNKKMYKIIIINAVKQQIKNFAEIEIGECVINASEEKMTA